MPQLKKEQKIFLLTIFRKNMGTTMPKEKVREFWEIASIKNKGVGSLKRDKKKIKIVEENLHLFLHRDWVKFIGITGSVAAGISKNEDDIDVLVVVKNNRMWIYRAILALRLGKKSLRRVWNKPYKNKIDTNFICEERGIRFNPESIFIFHELIFMIPVYNEKYYEKILNINYKLMENYCTKKRKKELPNKNEEVFFKIFNHIAFLLQYTYMIIKRHRPNYKRLSKNNKKGRIEFFPEDYRKKKEEGFKA